MLGRVGATGKHQEHGCRKGQIGCVHDRIVDMPQTLSLQTHGNGSYDPFKNVLCPHLVRRILAAQSSATSGDVPYGTWRGVISHHCGLNSGLTRFVVGKLITGVHPVEIWIVPALRSFKETCDVRLLRFHHNSREPGMPGPRTIAQNTECADSNQNGGPGYSSCFHI
jgi:hypothetical protein